MIYPFNALQRVVSNICWLKKLFATKAQIDNHRVPYLLSTYQRIFFIMQVVLTYHFFQIVVPNHYFFAKKILPQGVHNLVHPILNTKKKVAAHLRC